MFLCVHTCPEFSNALSVFSRYLNNTTPAHGAYILLEYSDDEINREIFRTQS
jgi:hypothetical protein